jgi:hypothetical protein
VPESKLSPLEYVSLRDCVAKYKAGQKIKSVLKMDAISPAVAYDTSIALKAVVSLSSGFAIGLSQPEADWEHLQVELFSLRVNPELGYAAALHGQRMQPVLNASVFYLYSIFNTTFATMFRAATMVIETGPSYDNLVDTATYVIERVDRVVSDLAGHHNNTIHDILVRTKELVHVSHQNTEVRLATGRKLLVSSFGTPLECAILSRAIVDVKLSASTAGRHFIWNIPRAACHLQKGCDLENHPASWMGVAPPTPPAPSPPPRNPTPGALNHGFLKVLWEFTDKYVSTSISISAGVYWNMFTVILPGRGTGKLFSSLRSLKASPKAARGFGTRERARCGFA